MKRASIEHIDLTSCEDDVSNEIRKKLSFEEERSTQVKIKEEVEVDDYDSYRYKQTAYVRDDRRLPKYSESSPNLEEIFNICLLHNVPDEMIVKVKPTRIKETVTSRRWNIQSPQKWRVESEDCEAQEALCCCT